MVEPKSDERVAAGDECERLAVCPACREAIQVLADELHDGMIQRIIAAKMVIEGVLAQRGMSTHAAESHSELEQSSLFDDLHAVQKWLEESLLEARSILDQFQLATNHEPLSELIGRWSARLTERVMIDIQIGSQFDDLTPVETQVVARVFQTIMGNLLQHSDADRLFVRGERSDSRNVIEFQDNGSIAKADFKPGVGLSAVARRIQSLNGSLTIASDQTGFCVRIAWPRR